MADNAPAILVPIDLHGINRTALETLVRIARQLDRGLLGLLLEDIRLQRVADLPFTTEITLNGGRERSLLRDHLSQRHSQVGDATRKLLHELAERNRVALSFEDASGNRWHTALERDGHLDIFFPARKRWQMSGATSDTAPSPISRLGIVLTGTERDDRLIETASTLLKAGLVRDSYVLCPRPPLPDYLRALYQPGQHQICVHSHFSCSPDEITALIQQSPYDMLMVSHDSLHGIANDKLDAALDKSSSQVLVVS